MADASAATGHLIAQAFAQAQADEAEDYIVRLLDEIGATWWRCHTLVAALDFAEPWDMLDAVLLECRVLAAKVAAP